jgi:hypothetical protein
LITIILVALAAYFGFLLGKRYVEGAEEEKRDAAIESAATRRGVRLRSITIRR